MEFTFSKQFIDSQIQNAIEFRRECPVIQKVPSEFRTLSEAKDIFEIVVPHLEMAKFSRSRKK